MKLVGLVGRSVLSLVVLSFLFGTTALTYAQDQRDEAKPPQQETRPRRANRMSPHRAKERPNPRNRVRTSLRVAKTSRHGRRMQSRPGSRVGPGNQPSTRNARPTIVGAASPTTSSAPNSAANTRLKSTARLRLRDNRVSNTGATRSPLLTYGPRIGPTLTTAMSTTSTGNISFSTCFILALESRLL